MVTFSFQTFRRVGSLNKYGLKALGNYMILSYLAALSLATSSVPERVEIQVGSLRREFLAFIPEEALTKYSPLVFAIHGHGGNGNNAARGWRYQSLWPNAVVIYPTGVPTAGKTDPEGLKNGWQKNQGDLDDRDLKFFDAMLSWTENHAKIDTHEIFCAGHSNGAGFTYLLWVTHPGLFAGIAATSGGFPFGTAKTPTPTACFISSGKKDSIVPYEYQLKVLNHVKMVDNCTEPSKVWTDELVQWESTSKTPVVFYSYDGPHKFPENTPSLIVRFFKEQIQK